MKIAIVKLSALGDVIHGMTVLQFIKQQYYKKIDIDWIVDENIPVRFQLQSHKYIWPSEKKGV